MPCVQLTIRPDRRRARIHQQQPRRLAVRALLLLVRRSHMWAPILATSASPTGQKQRRSPVRPDLVEPLAPSAGYRVDRALARLHCHGLTRRRSFGRRFGIAQSRESGCRAPHDRFRNPGSTTRTSATATSRSPRCGSSGVTSHVRLGAPGARRTVRFLIGDVTRPLPSGAAGWGCSCGAQARPRAPRCAPRR